MKARILLVVVILTTALAASSSAQTYCAPGEFGCDEAKAYNAPPVLTIRDEAVTIEEGETAFNAGTYDDSSDDVRVEWVEISASIGEVRKDGIDSGAWHLWIPPERYFGGVRSSSDPVIRIVTVTATDSSGRSSEAKFSLTVRRVPPIVSIDKPLEGATVNGEVPVQATAEDNIGVEGVTFLVNGEYLGWDATAPYEQSFDSAAVGDGPKVITVRAHDTWMSTAEETRTITTDNTVPETPKLLTPENGARTAGTFSVKGYAEPGSTVELLEGSSSLGKTVADRMSLFRISVANQAEGRHAYKILSTDPAGNSSAPSEPHTITVDNTRPSLVNLTPPNGARQVFLERSVAVHFSEPMKATSVNRTSFTLVAKGSDRPVKSRVTYDATKYIGVLDPARKLKPGTSYVAAIEGGHAGTKDLAGNSLTRSETWAFRTRR